jgi:histidinol-phosphate phosphatase family protein
MKRKAVFLDRDGTLIVDHGYIYDPEQIELLPDIIPALKTIQSAGYLLIIISNQSGVGRGYCTLEDVEIVNHRLEELLKQNGIKIKGVFYCPHTPEDKCNCRKPKPGMVLHAIKEYKIEPSLSYLVGDKWTDVEAALGAGVIPVWLTKVPYDKNTHSKSVMVTNSLHSWVKLMDQDGLI